MTLATLVKSGTRFDAPRETESFLRAVRDKSGLNAVLSCDEQAWLSAAAAPGSASVLAGVPIAVKDNINVVGFATTAATPALGGFRPRSDAPAVAKLRAAGMIMAAKTNLHEMAFGITSNNAATGAVRNPVDQSLIAGGSSGGSAAAVAAGMFPAALGSDTGGSCRIPAALCGICGMRPTTGRYGSGGVVPLSSTRDTIGPLARSVADLSVLDAVMSGEAPAVNDSVRLEGLRLGVPRAYFFENLDGDVDRVIAAALDALANAGAELVEADIPGIAELNNAVSFPVVLHEAARELPDFLRDQECDVSFDELVAQIKSPDVKGILGSLHGDTAIPDEVYREVLDRQRPLLQQVYAQYFATHKLAAAVYPTTPLPARPIGDDETVELNGERAPTFPTYIRNTDPGSNAGLPSISVPAGKTRAGLPVGIQLEGIAGKDRRLLSVAAAAQDALR